ncbi:MAG: cryptochrome/photolyase family protein, partial [Synergistales bacterium]|nr:cryptochrome/photolyase family protein [Synergistales bacterium]
MPAHVKAPPSEQVLLIFPTQLFQDHPGLLPGRRVLLMEHQLYFGDWNYFCPFHKKKILLHLASMAIFEEDLKKRGYQVTRIPYERKRAVLESLFQRLSGQGIKELFTLSPEDLILEKRLIRASRINQLPVTFLPNPSFLISDADEIEIPLRAGRYSMTSFYIMMRKQFDLLLDRRGNPLGGKWSFDPANRKKLPRGTRVPSLPELEYPSWINEIAGQVEVNFPDHPGDTQNFLFPLSRLQALEMLDHFLEQKLPSFGDYEDAMDTERPFLFHSMLSSSLNTGLLTPLEIVERVLKVFQKGSVPINSAEGFLRQIVGWREFMRLLYHRDGVRMRNSNFWEHTRPLPEKFLKGRTGVDPVDHVVGKVRQYAYTHHIERLMVLGNYLLLCEVHPNYVYNWFMSDFIDAFDWVMTPNVYGMSQFADGGSMAT